MTDDYKMTDHVLIANALTAALITAAEVIAARRGVTFEEVDPYVKRIALNLLDNERTLDL